MMAALLDAILAMAVLEAGFFLWRGRVDLLVTLLAGLPLLVAARLALADAAWPWLALALLAGGVGHVLDLRRRWR